MNRLFRRRRWLSLAMLLGWGLAALGGVTIAAAHAASSPGTAGQSTRIIVTVAFAIAQSGLMLVAAATCLRLYRHAVRITRGSSRK